MNIKIYPILFLCTIYSLQGIQYEGRLIRSHFREVEYLSSKPYYICQICPAYYSGYCKNLPAIIKIVKINGEEYSKEIIIKDNGNEEYIRYIKNRSGEWEENNTHGVLLPNSFMDKISKKEEKLWQNAETMARSHPLRFSVRIAASLVGIGFISFSLYEYCKAWNIFSAQNEKKKNKKWLIMHALLGTASLAAGGYLLYLYSDLMR